MTDRIAVRPPELFPRCSFLALADHVDELILGDTFPYSRQSHQNRAPIRTPDGRMWLTVPLEHGSGGVPIREVRPAHELWAGKFQRSLRFNYSSAPFYEHYIHYTIELLLKKWTSLGELTVESTRLMLKLFRIDTPLTLASSIPGYPRRLADVASARSSRLVSTPEAADRDERAASLHEVVSIGSAPYRQVFAGFEPDLSGLDLLFNWGPESLPMLRERRIVTAIGKGHVKPAGFTHVG